MMYVDYKFEITPQGLVMLDKPDTDEKYMIQLKNTPFEVGDKFTLETTEDGRMFFKKDGPVQLNLEI
jgi:hypothetical protein